MLYLVTSSYNFVRELINELNLKRDNEIKNFEIFKKDDIVLIITEQNDIYQAMATTYIIERFHLNDDDIVVNVGMCYSEKNDKKIFIANSVFDVTFNRSYYTDMLFNLKIDDCNLNFERNIKNFKNNFDFFDNYSLGFYCSANNFLKRDRIFIIRISTNDINAYINKKINFENLSNIIDDFINLSKKINKQNVFNEDENLFLQKVCDNLKFTKTMRINFLQLMEYVKLNKKYDIKNILEKYLYMEINNKREVKKYFDEIREKFMAE